MLLGEPFYAKIKNLFFGEDSHTKSSGTLAFANHERSEVGNRRLPLNHTSSAVFHYRYLLAIRYKHTKSFLGEPGTSEEIWYIFRQFRGCKARECQKSVEPSPVEY